MSYFPFIFVSFPCALGILLKLSQEYFLLYNRGRYIINFKRALSVWPLGGLRNSQIFCDIMSGVFVPPL